MARPCRQKESRNMAQRMIYSRILRWAGHVDRIEEATLQTG
jgi:hypothetical protein